jgi:hypothetical protein
MDAMEGEELEFEVRSWLYQAPIKIQGIIKDNGDISKKNPTEMKSMQS